MRTVIFIDRNFGVGSESRMSFHEASLIHRGPGSQLQADDDVYEVFGVPDSDQHDGVAKLGRTKGEVVPAGYGSMTVARYKGEGCIWLPLKSFSYA